MSAIDAADVKIGRAAQHIDAIRDAVLDYTEREPSGVVRQADGSGKLQFHEQPPPIIAVLAGEVIYQLKSTLDHLAFELVKLNPLSITLPPTWQERCQFPLMTKVPITGDPPVNVQLPLPYNFLKGRLPGITEAAFRFIESVQPHYRREGTYPLGWLEELSKIDKHRHLNVINPQAMRRDEAVVRYKGHIFHNTSVRRVNDGAETEDPFFGDLDVVEVKMQGAFQPFVSFDESALGPDAEHFQVDHVLQSCLDTVQKIIIPAFDQFLKNP